MKRLIALICACAIMLIATANASPKLYGQEEIIEHPVDGMISVCRAPEKDCTLEALNDWFYNYVLETDYAWYMILYEESSNKGIYADKERVELNVIFAKDSKGWYVGSRKYAMTYLPSGEDGLILSMGC